jgi:hypothetical protein
MQHDQAVLEPKQGTQENIEIRKMFPACLAVDFFSQELEVLCLIRDPINQTLYEIITEFILSSTSTTHQLFQEEAL